MRLKLYSKESMCGGVSVWVWIWVWISIHVCHGVYWRSEDNFRGLFLPSCWSRVCLSCCLSSVLYFKLAGLGASTFCVTTGVLALQMHTTTSGFLHRSQGLNPGRQPCVTSTFPQPQALSFKDILGIYNVNSYFFANPINICSLLLSGF